jgi:hypothetical protein
MLLSPNPWCADRSALTKGNERTADTMFESSTCMLVLVPKVVLSASAKSLTSKFSKGRCCSQGKAEQSKAGKPHGKESTVHVSYYLIPLFRIFSGCTGQLGGIVEGKPCSSEVQRPRFHGVLV